MNIRTKRWLKGLVTSWTAHAGTTLAILGYMQTQDKILTQWFGPDAVGIIMVVFGILVVGLRAKTTESLISKGTK